MWELDHKESWAPKNWYFWTVVLDKALESPLDCKIKPVNPKGNQSWMLIERMDAEAETPIFWPPDVKNWLFGKDPDAGKDWGQVGDERGWDGWMVSLTQWSWVWASSGSWWWTGKPGVLQSMGLQRIGHDWATELIRPRLWYFVAAAQMDSDNYYLSSSFDSKIWVRLKIYSSTYGLRLAEFENLKGLLANTASL